LGSFCTFCRDFVFYAGVLRLTTEIQAIDDLQWKYNSSIEKALKEAIESNQKTQNALKQQEEIQHLETLKHTNPLEYAKIQAVKMEEIKKEKEKRKQEKIEIKKQEKIKEMEEEKAILKEKKLLNLLAETNPMEYEKHQKDLDLRIQRFEENKKLKQIEKEKKKQQQQQQQQKY
jgi:hypothetical protein